MGWAGPGVGGRGCGGTRPRRGADEVGRDLPVRGGRAECARGRGAAAGGADCAGLAGAAGGEGAQGGRLRVGEGAIPPGVEKLFQPVQELAEYCADHRYHGAVPPGARRPRRQGGAYLVQAVLGGLRGWGGVVHEWSNTNFLWWRQATMVTYSGENPG